ncbi:hypothetical protein ACB098_06G184700 [Castanea mollissima]|uniref:Uncharacterized protein n=1 Tax=Castanea mollissima TaxID=60419 RepID=A0A8J4R857_9ROSI|nr:hypothetical protein CMV_015986 [Castanea mollissima]
MVRKNQTDSSDDEDDTFYYRYPSSSSSNPASTTTSKPQQNANTNDNRAAKAKTKGGSKGLAPSKSTLYVSNLDYTLTNSDLHTLFSTFGKIARVTVLKDRVTRQSRGVAFVQFVSQDHALSAARQMHGKILNGRTISASIAADNGRAPEFIRKRVYKDKSRCYECGDEGHLSYECPKNQLGPRERPVPKKPRGGGGGGGGGGFRIGDRGYDDDDEEEEEEEEVVGLEDDNWASVVDGGANQRLLTDGVVEVEEKKRKKKVKKASYFSDESEEDE